MKKVKTRIERIAAETLAALAERGADVNNPHSSEVRFVTNYIVKHSELAELFKIFGIKRGQDIHRSFLYMPNVKFFEYVYLLYYLHYLTPDYIRVKGGMGYFFNVPNKKLFTARMYDVRDQYFELRRGMKQQRDASMAVAPVQACWFDMALFKTMMKSRAPFGVFKETYLKNISPAMYAIMCMFRGEVFNPKAQEYLREHENLVNFEFVSNGVLRSLLSHFHGLTLPKSTDKDPVVRNIEDASDEYIVNALGISHAEYNAMATEYQDDLQRKLDLMEVWELLEGEPYFGTEPSTEQMINDYDDEADVLTAGSLTSASVPKAVMDLADKLAQKHGPVTIASEASGLHIYLPDPDLLRIDGMKELYSKHLALNADKYLGIGAYDIDEYPTKENQILYNKYRRKNKEVPSAVSMKTKKVYMVSDLMAYVPISKRHSLFSDVKAKVITGSVRKRLVYDENGNLVPEWCGSVTPLHDLPANHPAVEYLANRGYNIHLLEDQFECCYCHEALPESRGEGRYYSRLPGGMVNSPQGRIIFTIRMNGVRLGYQSRCIDKWVGDKYYFWAPSQKWMLIKKRLPDGSIEEIYPPDANFPKGFDPHKYLNATGSERNKLLMGFDAAVEFNKARPFNKRYCVLVEGPLDAARIGTPAIALLGKSMSPYQAAEIRKNFARVITVMDNDAAGQQCLRKIYQQLPSTPIVEAELPKHVKDVGELTYMEAYNLISPYDPIISTR